MEDPDAKRPRIADERDVFEDADNGHEEKEEEPKEDITEPADAIKDTESEDDQEKANESLDAAQKASVTDEPLDAVNIESVTNELVNKESATDETHEKAVEPLSDENLEESAKVEHQGSGVEQDPTFDVTLQDDLSGFKEQPTYDDQPTFDDQPTSRRMEIPSNKVGVLIGKAGDTIRTLQYSSGARIQITRDSEADPNAATRPVQILGSLESINKAERLIKEVIAEAEAGGSPSLVARGFSAHPSGIGEQLHIQVPNEKVGVIIGKGGDTIKSLQTRSGARIQLIPQHLPEGDQSKERTVRVTGDRKQIELAREMIKEVMDQVIRMLSSICVEKHQKQLLSLRITVDHFLELRRERYTNAHLLSSSTSQVASAYEVQKLKQLVESQDRECAREAEMKIMQEQLAFLTKAWKDNFSPPPN